LARAGRAGLSAGASRAAVEALTATISVSKALCCQLVEETALGIAARGFASA